MPWKSIYDFALYSDGELLGIFDEKRITQVRSSDYNIPIESSYPASADEIQKSLNAFARTKRNFKNIREVDSFTYLSTMFSKLNILKSF